MISQTDIEQLFTKMRKASWNMEQELAWGYFFKDSHKESLVLLAQELSKQGYEVIDINQSYPDNSYWLHIEKIEQHSVVSLHQRNQEFYQLAKEMNIHTYDGMDISPLDFFKD